MLRRLLRRSGTGNGTSGIMVLLALCLPSVVVVLLILVANESHNRFEVEKQEINDKLADLHGQFDHLRMIDQAKRKAFFDLQHHLQIIVDVAEKANISHLLQANLSHNNLAMIRRGKFLNLAAGISNADLNLREPYSAGSSSLGASFMGSMTDSQRKQFIANLSATALNPDLSIPNLFDHLPHLQHYSDALKPTMRVDSGSRRTGVHLVIGIPTTKRPKVSYLVQSLRSLFDNLTPLEKQDVLIVVFVGEQDGLTEWAQEELLLLQSEFPEHIQSGLLEVVVPSKNFYPNLTAIPPTFTDSPERMIWRTKQNLDYAYLMMYCQGRGRFYMQLEDDVVTKVDFFQKIKDYIVKQTGENGNWFLLEFSSLGFIGKLFKTLDLPRVIEFILLFHKEKPVDWLLDNILDVMQFNPEKSPKACQETKNKYRIRHKPSLFQHIGTHSSLKDKIQKLKEEDFGKQSLHRPHSNPPAAISTSLKTYQNYSIDRAYTGETFFWGLLPQPGDWIKFELTPPVRIESLVFRSGNPEHPDDMFYNTSVEIRAQNAIDVKHFERTEDGFAVVCWFNPFGSALVSLNSTGTVSAVRIVVHSESQNWVILNELWIRPMDSWTEPIVLVPEPPPQAAVDGSTAAAGYDNATGEEHSAADQSI